MTRGRAVPTSELIEKELRALELRRAGVTYDVIATELGFANKGGAYKAVQRALKRTLQEPADELIVLEVDRLDRLQRAVWQAAMRGDLGAVTKALQIAERRARLLGLDRPTVAAGQIEGELIVRFGIPRPDFAAADAAAVDLPPTADT